MGGSLPIDSIGLLGPLEEDGTKGLARCPPFPHHAPIFEAELSVVLLSLDIDGTLEIGDPPGDFSLALVRRALELGYIVGSASDRVMSDQQRLWQAHRIEVHFVGHKHKLDEVRARFPQTRRWIHIGDGNADEVYARKHGFEFHWAHEVPKVGSAGWIF